MARTRFQPAPQVILSVIIVALIAVAPLAVAAAAAPAPLSRADAERLALEYLHTRAAAMGLAQEDVADVRVTDAYASRHNGVTHVHLIQQYRGIEVAGARVTINVTADGRTFEVGHRFQPDLVSRAQAVAPTLSAEDALAKAMAGAGARALPASEAPPAKLVYQLVDGGGLRLAWELTIAAEGTSASSEDVVVDASSGQVLERRPWKRDLYPETAVASAPVGSGSDAVNPPTVLSPDSYQVFAIPKDHPDDGPRTVEANPAASGGAASPFGWHDTNGAAGPEFNVSRGNCAHAYTDVDGNNAPDAGSEAPGGAGNDYLLPLDLAQEPSMYRPAAVTNAFYWANICHDVLWNYGFDEPSRNFQTNNFGRGGVGNDAMLVEVQDGSGTNNANLAVGADGVAPRMQLFRFTSTVPSRDAALANGVVASLYMFGAASRLVGGAPTCLNAAESGGMQLGWADWFDLVMTAVPADVGATPRGIATYLLGQPATGTGIRPKPYSTDFGVNNFTYGNVQSGVAIHTVGTIWATMLWEVYWELVNAHGFNSDIYDHWSTGGNNLALQLIVDAMKIAPCNPGFADGRSAILAADIELTGGANRCAIWRAFARRGLGAGATQGSSSNLGDGSAAFDLPAVCQAAGVEDSPRGFDHALAARPNPFTPQTKLAFALAVPSRVAIEIFDLHGRRVRRIDADHRAAGPQEIAWDGRGEDGRPLGSGEYVLRLLINGQTAATTKATRIR